ncbi:hypothetical protein Leryth_004053 [Lithospermum erythrorhizon]|uniref:Uncharacterized protein n=1 Tax=Lithospermum erythrorhizon TaxID=34254 RepID=A0AAV3PW28_LITER|nr:hypothetical protein Leryth_004053 [Lithospermum erythrorhizon]
MENSNGTSEGFTKWLGMSVASAFFASLEQCSCVSLTTYESDDEDFEHANGRPLMFTNSRHSNSSISTTTPKSINVENHHV